MDTPICVFQSEAILGESPIWDREKQLLFWVDTPSCIVYSFDPSTREASRRSFPEPIAAISLRKQGGLILVMRNRVGAFDGKKTTTLVSLQENPLVNYLNDAKCDRRGRLWCGTKNHLSPGTPSAALYYLDAEHHLHCAQKQVAQSNGTGWSPDNKILYHTETMHHTIFAYDFDSSTASLSNRRTFAKIDPKDGVPDGLTVDAEGCVWSALYGKGKIMRFTPNGKQDRVVQLIVPHVTNCTFGGNKLDTLYITTARENLSDSEVRNYPLSGSIFALKAGVVGLPEPRYAG